MSSNINRKIFLWVSLKAVFKKEFRHILRSPSVMVFALLFPLLEMILLGYILDLNPRRVKTVVYDLANTQQSHTLIDRFVNSNDFRIIKIANSDQELYETIVAGQAKVGIKIPLNYSTNLLKQQTAQVLVVVDGTNTTVTSEMINTANRIGLEESVQRLLSSDQKAIFNVVPVESRPSVLFNPDARSANFFLPGLIIWELPAITIILVALSIVGEKEKGNIDQLRMTPIDSLGAVLGKTLPYAVLAILLELEMLIVSYYLFGMPIKGSILLLILLLIPFILIDLGTGVIVSGFANNQKTALQMAVVFRVIPPFYLSGYIFQIETMPKSMQFVTRFVPHRYAIEIVRGILLRGAGLEHLWPQALILIAMSIVIILGSAFIYKQKVIN